MQTSPYAGVPKTKWAAKTKELVAGHPLKPKETVEIVLTSWKGIFSSRIGQRGFKIGRNIFLRPQIMGFLLEELISAELNARYPDKWRGQRTKQEKDLVYIPDPIFSFEIKTSSHPHKIFGNRSYAQPTRNLVRAGAKDKSGYYLAINFDKFDSRTQPAIRLIRFGWLDHSDWIGQTAATGQQARLTEEVEQLKFVTLYRE